MVLVMSVLTVMLVVVMVLANGIKQRRKQPEGDGQGVLTHGAHEVVMYCNKRCSYQVLLTVKALFAHTFCELILAVAR